MYTKVDHCHSAKPSILIGQRHEMLFRPFYRKLYRFYHRLTWLCLVTSATNLQSFAKLQRGKLTLLVSESASMVHRSSQMTDPCIILDRVSHTAEKLC